MDAVPGIQTPKKALAVRAQPSDAVPTRKTLHPVVGLQGGDSTRRYLKTPQEHLSSQSPLRVGRKRSGTGVGHGQQLAKRSRENLCELSPTRDQPTCTQLQGGTEDQIEVDGLEELNLEPVREWRRANNLQRKDYYVEKSVGAKTEVGMSETVKEGLLLLPKLSLEELEGGLEGGHGQLRGSSDLITAEEKLKRLEDWVASLVPYETLRWVPL